MIPTLLRSAEHKALSHLTLAGSILDLGGDTRSKYRDCIQGDHTFTTVNFDQRTTPSIFHDLEQPLPIQDHSYDHVLLINVLEHIYAFHQLLGEAARVVRPGGSIIIVVPFLFPLHPSPNDYWRFSAQALQKECEKQRLVVQTITPLGSGVCAARHVMLERLLPFPIRALLFLVRPLIVLVDLVFAFIAKAFKKKYQQSDYALGFLVCAQASSNTV